MQARPAGRPFRDAIGTRPLLSRPVIIPRAGRTFCTGYKLYAVDPRPGAKVEVIEDEYATVRETYKTPKNPIVLAHGLLGFDELRLTHMLPGVKYWRGITEAFRANGVEVITTSVPPSGSVEARGQKLSEDIQKKAGGKSVNIIAGLDSRYMISRLKPPEVNVLSLTTIATPHRGSSFADYVFDQIGVNNMPRVYKALEYLGFETEAFSQLTRKYMEQEFNPHTPDREGVRYYSYGANVHPSILSAFRHSHSVVKRSEGENDGLVSVESSKWGKYQGTLSGVSHLDLINWTNRLRWMIWEMAGNKRNFNAIAFYLHISDMLAREGL